MRTMRIAICLNIGRRLYKFFYASAVNIRDLLSQLKNPDFDVSILISSFLFSLCINFSFFSSSSSSLNVNNIAASFMIKKQLRYISSCSFHDFRRRYDFNCQYELSIRFLSHTTVVSS